MEWVLKMLGASTVLQTVLLRATVQHEAGRSHVARGVEHCSLEAQNMISCPAKIVINEAI